MAALSNILRSFACVLVAGLVFASFVPGGAQAVNVREDLPGPDYLVGSLTWNQGKGVISWSGAPSEDDAALGAAATFTSEALPRTLHLNASRLIQVDLQWKGNNPGGTLTSCTTGAQLFAGERLVGGVKEPQVFSPYAEGEDWSWRPAEPAGYTTCRLRIAAELPILAQGTVLRLQLALTKAGPWGMVGEHQSVLRLPYFADEEVPYRFPVYAHGGPAGVPNGSSTLTQLLAGMGVGVAAIGRRRGGARAFLVAAALVGVAAGGCLAPRAAEADGQDAADGEEPVPLTPVYQTGNLSVEGLGSLIGQVTSSDVGQPLVGASVSLLGTPNFKRTDPYGRFVFRDLVPGTYRVHADKDGYESFQGTVAVEADLIARIDVLLDPVGGLEAGTRPHRHDYWDTKTEIVLMDRVNLGQSCPANAAAQYTGCQPTTLFTIPHDVEGFSSIRPGTYGVTIKLEWDMGSYASSPMGLLFQANNDPSLNNWSELLPRPVGEPFHIVASWEMGDPGHQAFSTWVFQVTNITYGPNMYLMPVDYAKYFQRRPTINVTMSIHKGVIPLEPPHPDPWKGASSVHVIYESAQEVAESDTTKPWDKSWLPSKIIPPETTWVEVIANRSNTQVVPYDVDLRYRTAEEGAPSADCWAYPGNGGLCHGPEYKTVGPGTKTGNNLRWVLPVTDVEPDPYYTRHSFWVFGLSRGADAQDAVGNDVNYAYNYVDHFFITKDDFTTYTFSVIAHRDAVPTS